MKKPTLIKPWHRLGMTRKQYKSARPWKKAGVQREKYEALILKIPQDVITELRAQAEADLLMEQIFGKELSEELE